MIYLFSLAVYFGLIYKNELIKIIQYGNGKNYANLSTYAIIIVTILIIWRYSKKKKNEN